VHGLEVDHAHFIDRRVGERAAIAEVAAQRSNV
jgi:hypothetical protein